MVEYPDLMVDIETTGNPETMGVDTIGIIQIAAVKFNLETREIGGVFNRCLALAPNRHWSEDTRTWWYGKNRKVFDSILARMEDPQQVVRDFYNFATSDVPEGGARFWAKPTTFDYSILVSYFRQYGLPSPCHFRIARDLNTYMAARAGSAKHQDMAHIEMVGDAHDALADTFHQLKMLFAADDGNFGPQLIEAVATEVVT